MRSLILLGSTGSIGRQTLELLAADRASFRVEGLAAARSWRELLDQARTFRPRFVALQDAESAALLRAELPAETALLAGPDAAVELARLGDYELAVHGIVGAAGVRVSAAVLERGRTLALANKESLVVAGAPLMALARERGATILPVDSEHSAVFQCLRGENIGRVRRVILTGSGGPFRTAGEHEIARATPEEALRHPNWSMGPRITVGSATLMNKAFEIIELHHLFGLERERIEVAIHPQSIVHSLVEFVDGSVIAQMGPPDMKGPIHHALHHPDRAPATLRGFDFRAFRELTFEEPDLARFPALELGYECVATGSDSGAVLNAADEVAVEAFLREEIGFGDLVRVARRTLARRPGFDRSVEDLLRSDAAARELARAEIAALRAAVA
ncbi:MAG: 1-deoxy-D-xylulose-5-phosphate reductoisomerase [Planctomycetes bacterium]|nr:1-deoxy-D-xylulose-5-phosphate reductoisomerase [Planctomycetota bacterium]